MSTSTATMDRIKQLLGSGVSPAVAATALGCDPSYISQLLSDETFREAVQQLKFNNLQAAAQRDSQIDTLEDELLKKLKVSIPMIVQPAMLLKAFSVINAAKRRSVPIQEQTIINNTIVNLELPAAKHRIQFQQNSSNEIIEVEGRPLATLPSTVVAGLAATMVEQRQAETALLQEKTNDLRNSIKTSTNQTA